MHVNKAHVLTLISGLLVLANLPVAAQIAFSLNTSIEYRQNKNEIKFSGGSFDVEMLDGNGTYFCDSSFYYGPGLFRGLCSTGTTGFLTAGSIGGASFDEPYLVINTLNPARSIQPFKPELITLQSAPPSTLTRPSGGFKDDSASVYFNLNTSLVEEYNITRYFFNKEYSKSDREKFQSEIVPGVYQYIFPGLNPTGQDFAFRPTAVQAIVYPMVEGYRKFNNTDQGVRFTDVNGNRWNKDGYLELSYLRPNVIKWEGFNPTTVFAGVDTLYFSLRALRDVENPEKSSLVEREAIFPAFDNERESRIALRNPYQSQFTVPPVFPSGTRAMVELQLLRNFKTGGVTFDFSSRKFQIPVIVVNRFTDYEEIFLLKSNQKSLLSDPDGDGFNNLTEWILGSSGSDRASFPTSPVPATFDSDNDFDYDDIFIDLDFDSYFGFNVPVQTDTVPAVTYLLQRSLDQGKTWQEFKEGYYLPDGTFTTVPLVDYSFGYPFILTPHNWGVRKVTTVSRGVTYIRFEVRSGIQDPANFFGTIQPPGTQAEIFRVKVVLKKKKKGK